MRTNREQAFRGSFRVELPLSDITEAVDYRSLIVTQAMERHDVAEIVIRSRYEEYFDTLYAGSPVRIEYGTWDATAVFLGYIAKVVPTEKVNGDVYERRIQCVAASREFRNTARHTWRNRTAPEIVQDIGDRMGFRVITRQHGLRRKHVSMGGDTYWETLVKLARMTGYVLRADGTTLYFLPLKDMIASFASTSPVLADVSMINDYWVTALEINTAMGNTSDDNDDLSDAAVVVSLGPNDSDASEAREVPESVVRRRRATSSTYEKFNPSVVAHTARDARLLAKGMADRGMLAYDGRVYGQGDPYIVPYRPVFLATADQAIRGYWVVKEVTHKITNDAYTCETIISTDEISPQRADPPPTRFRDLSAEATQGWSATEIDRSTLRVLSPSFVSGSTFRPDSRIAQWVSV